jgi:hypothetical protein
MGCGRSTFGQDAKPLELVSGNAHSKQQPPVSESVVDNALIIEDWNDKLPPPQQQQLAISTPPVRKRLLDGMQMERTGRKAKAFQIQKMFEYFDKDSSGSIELDEFGLVCKELGFELNETELFEFLCMIDLGELMFSNYALHFFRWQRDHRDGRISSLVGNSPKSRVQKDEIWEAERKSERLSSLICFGSSFWYDDFEMGINSDGCSQRRISCNSPKLYERKEVDLR